MAAAASTPLNAAGYWGAGVLLFPADAVTTAPELLAKATALSSAWEASNVPKLILITWAPCCTAYEIALASVNKSDWPWSSNALKGMIMLSGATTAIIPAQSVPWL